MVWIDEDVQAKNLNNWMCNIEPHYRKVDSRGATRDGDRKNIVDQII